MIQTLSTAEAAYRLRHDDYGDWSVAGAYAMVQYLEQLEADAGHPLEFDEAAIRCDYSEYETALDAALDYGFAPTADPLSQDAEAEARVWLAERTTLIDFHGGLIIAAF